MDERIEYFYFDGYCIGELCGNKIQMTMIKGKPWKFICNKCGKIYEGENEINPLRK
jgi:hypothetical protein